MARRLNKKVALIGSTVFLLLALGAVVVILMLGGDPAQFVAEGDAAYAAKDYESALRHYARAFRLAQSSQERTELLFKQADVYRDMNKWAYVRGRWHEILTADPDNVRALMARLKYGYILADSLAGAGPGANSYWQSVHTDASKLLELARSSDLMDTPKADLEPSFGSAEVAGWDAGMTRLGPYLYMAKGRAAFELALGQATTAPGAWLDEARDDLTKAKELDPNRAAVYHHLAGVYWEQGENAGSRGDLNAKEEAVRQAEAVLAEGVQAAGDTPEAHLNQLTHRLAQARRRDVVTARDHMAALAPEYRALAERFAESAEVFGALAEFYSYEAVYSESKSAAPKLDLAIAAAEKARTLDSDRVVYARYAALLYFRRFSLYGDNADLDKAMAVAEDALKLPDAQDTPGPRQFATQANKFQLCSFLARCYVERLLAPEASASETDALLARAEKAVHEIEQIRGSGENPEVVMWQGMLELARGHTSEAIRGLYAAHEQIKASSPGGQADPYLAYRLAQIFKGTTEVGAVLEFLGSALQAGIVETRPDALLDYAEAARRARSYDVALRAAKMYDDQFGVSNRSRVLRIEALIDNGNISEAEGEVAALPAEDPNSLMLRLELARAQSAQLRNAVSRAQTAGEGPLRLQPGPSDRGDSTAALQALTAQLREQYRQEADLLVRYLQTKPEEVQESRWVPLCEALVRQGDVDLAQRLVGVLEKRGADSGTVLFYRDLLREPEPSAVSADRRREIRTQAIAQIADPVQRALELGSFYQAEERIDDAVAQWRNVLDATIASPPPGEPAYLHVTRLSPRHVAASHLFDAARHRQDWALAGEIAEIAKNDNLDDCNGYLFAARLAFAREQHEEALAHLDECLRRRPIFSYGYLLRGNVHAALGNQHAAVEDLTKAAALNPADPVVARGLAHALYQRNQNLGQNASSEQRLQARRALEQAVQLNPREMGLLEVYADYITADEPLRALALRQTIQIHAPTLRNAVKLGQLATWMALDETDEDKKGAYLRSAEWAFEQARQMDPNDQYMLDSYAAYYRARGQHEKAQQLLLAAQDSQLLWRHYFHVGRFAEARELLQRMYAQDESKIDALKGLALVAQRTGDKEAVKRYTEELLTLEDDQTNRLTQVQAFLDVGLARDAELKLQSFKERFPDDPRVLMLEALLAMRQGQLDRAWELANRHLERYGEDAAVRRLRGQVSRLKGDYDQAIRDFRKSRQLEDSPMTATHLADAYVWAGREEEAIRELEEVVDQAGAPREARTLLERLYGRLGRTAALERLYAETLARDPNNVEWLTRAGGFALDRGDYAKAEALYEKACRLKRNESSAVDAQTTARDVQYAAALDGYLRALILAAGDPNAGNGQWRPQHLDRVFETGGRYADTAYAPVAFYRMAEAYKKLGQMDAAADYCRRAMDASWSDDRTALEVLLRIYLLMGPDVVSTYCHERLRTDPDSAAANYTMFNLAKLKGDFDEALRYIDACLRLSDPQTPRYVQYMIKKAEALTLAYKRTADNSHLDKAIAVYESLLAKMPKNSSVLNNLAYMLAQSDRELAQALEYARQAVELSPDQANYLDTYGLVLYRNGKPDKAAEMLAAAIQRYELDGQAPAEVYEHMGQVHEALGDNVKAVAAYRRALEVGGNAMSDGARDRLASAIKRLAP